MNKVISISEIVAPIQVDNDLCEVWASADATYHKGELEVNLDSFLRRYRDDQHLPASWLPKSETVIERVDLEEGSPAAKEIFANWVKRVRRALGGRGHCSAASVSRTNCATRLEVRRAAPSFRWVMSWNSSSRRERARSR